MFSNVKSQMSGWLGNAAIPTMPSMPAMPAMPSMPSIPGLRKGTTTTDDGAINEVIQENAVDAGNVGAVDEEDRSRYIRYGPCINDGNEMVFFFKSLLSDYRFGFFFIVGFFLFSIFNAIMKFSFRNSFVFFFYLTWP